ADSPLEVMHPHERVQEKWKDRAALAALNVGQECGADQQQECEEPLLPGHNPSEQQQQRPPIDKRLEKRPHAPDLNTGLYLLSRGQEQQDIRCESTERGEML